MSLGAAAAAISLGAVLHYGFGEELGTGLNHTLLAAAVALLGYRYFSDRKWKLAERA